MTVLAVDLASKLSAACLMNEDYTVLHEVDSFGCTEEDFLFEITRFFTPDSYTAWTPEVMVVEDLPHGLSYSGVIKDVCRLQGRLYDRMQRQGRGGDVLFLAPAQWRRHYLGLERGTGPEAVVGVAEKLGYVAPMNELITRAKGHGGLTRAKKVGTDYCSAYLIARWATETRREHHTLDVVGTSRYNTRAITKKDAAL